MRSLFRSGRTVLVPLWVACVIHCAATVVVAQSPAFDVASVRLTASSILPVNRVTGARVDLVTSLRAVVVSAFRVKDYQLIAGGSLNDLFVEIRATIPPGSSVQQVPEMLRQLLIDRFGLAAHSESRTMDAYHLQVGSGGIKMREVEAVNDLDKQFDPQFTSSGQPMADSVTQAVEGPVRTISIPGGQRRVTSRTMYERTTGHGRVTINAIRMTMAELAPLLTMNLDQPVVDRTGLTGIYQFKIELPTDELWTTTVNDFARARGLSVNTTPTGASTFRSVESLGLKLERRPTSIDVVVIDKINRTPTDN